MVKYLAGLDPTNPTWAGVFCNQAAVSCVTPPEEHKFIWTTDRPSGAAERTCTMGHGGAGRHGCQDVRKGHGHW